MTSVLEHELLRDDILAIEPFRLIGTRCEPAGHVTFPRRDFCPTCHSADVENCDLPLDGTLETFTTVRQAPPGLAVPYMLGFVKLDGPVVLLSRIVGGDRVAPQIGARVHAIPYLLNSSGKELLAFAFELVEEDRNA
ncbi:Zn-ribbon domain-containing OB-fold protein [Sciscionella sediminilitoris]|uniref:Zn-ribbon domain-containing OB-fold protein n=1 Tax=Sciscionella sediminilitoris TaxID=1445613 RepID=UPI00068C350A|nr:OB-fold domain-containing protein [Sciscionella sp. SE31]